MEKPKKSNRIQKVNSLIEHSLGSVLLEFLQEQKGIITISKVETSRDMKWAKVWISILPLPTASAALKQEDRLKAKTALDDKILNFIKKNIYYIQGEVNKHFPTKIFPRLSFHLDTSPRYVEHIDELIRKVHEEES